MEKKQKWKVWKPEERRWILIDESGLLYDVTQTKQGIFGIETRTLVDIGPPLAVVRNFEAVQPVPEWVLVEL